MEKKVKKKNVWCKPEKRLFEGALNTMTRVGRAQSHELEVDQRLAHGSQPLEYLVFDLRQITTKQTTNHQQFNQKS